jgi:hypothetical protein
VATIQISTHINVSPEILWEELRHINRHVNWMNDAVSITFTSPTTEGVGTQFSCLTKVGPFKTTDIMTITQWQENKTMGVEHVGLVKGTGTFHIEPHGEGSTITWKESLSFPLFFLGSLGALAATPPLTYIWKKNLTNLKNIVEGNS